MLSKRLVEQDGYTRDNLTEENKLKMEGADYLYEQALEYVGTFDDEDTILDKMKSEIKQEAIHDMIAYLDIQRAEFQIDLIENQIEDTIENIEDNEEKE